MLRQSVGLAWQVDTQPITYFLADSGTRNVVDLNIVTNSWASHESLPGSSGRVNIDTATLNFRASPNALCEPPLRVRCCANKMCRSWAKPVANKFGQPIGYRADLPWPGQLAHPLRLEEQNRARQQQPLPRGQILPGR